MEIGSAARRAKKAAVETAKKSAETAQEVVVLHVRPYKRQREKGNRKSSSSSTSSSGVLALLMPSELREGARRGRALLGSVGRHSIRPSSSPSVYARGRHERGGLKDDPSSDEDSGEDVSRGLYEGRFSSCQEDRHSSFSGVLGEAIRLHCVIAQTSHGSQRCTPEKACNVTGEALEFLVFTKRGGFRCRRKTLELPLLCRSGNFRS